MDRKSAFKIGSAAAARVGNCSERYVCPLCLRSFHEDDLKALTIEHVPAKAVGGKGLTLTCEACNSEAGSRLQANQAEEVKLTDFWAGALSRPLNVEVFTNHGTLRGEGNFDGERQIMLEVQKNRMNPAETAALQLNTDALTYTGFKIGKKFEYHKARIADLRDAYLWVFARFGYKAVAQPWMDWIRKAISEGESTNKKWCIITDDPRIEEWQRKVGGPIMCFLRKPRSAILVCSGNRAVLLPSDLNRDPYSDLADDKAELEFGPNVWIEKVPDTMMMDLDFSPLQPDP